MISTNLRYNPPNLANIITNLPRNLRGPAVETASIYLIGNEYRGLKHYPNRPNSKYIRTYKLRAGWVFSSDGVRSRIFNAVEYAPFVQGDNTQAWMHVGIWNRVSDSITSNTQGMIHAVDQMAQRYIREQGL